MKRQQIVNNLLREGFRSQTLASLSDSQLLSLLFYVMICRGGSGIHPGDPLDRCPVRLVHPGRSSHRVSRRSKASRFPIAVPRCRPSSSRGKLACHPMGSVVRVVLWQTLDQLSVENSRHGRLAKEACRAFESDRRTSRQGR